MSRKVKIKRKKKPLKLPKIKNKPKLLKIKKVGYWCSYYEGRIPFPIECSYNKQMPYECIFIHGKKKVIKDFPECKTCDRFVSWEDWKLKKWDKIQEEVKKGKDLRNEPIPFKRSE